MEFIAELESKIDALVDAYNRLKEQKSGLEAHSGEKDARIQSLEDENRTLKEEMQSLRETAAEQQEKLDSAAQRVQGLIGKLEAVE
jgi:chromosome segregation ATPase